MMSGFVLEVGPRQDLPPARGARARGIERQVPDVASPSPKSNRQLARSDSDAIGDDDVAVDLDRARGRATSCLMSGNIPTILLLIAGVAAMAGCASQSRPILYPNPHLSSVGQAQADADLAECRRMAETAGASGASGHGERAARDSAVGGAIGGATGAAGGAVLGAPGTGAAHGRHRRLHALVVPERPPEPGLPRLRRPLSTRARLRAGGLGVGAARAAPRAVVEPCRHGPRLVLHVSPDRGDPAGQVHRLVRHGLSSEILASAE